MMLLIPGPVPSVNPVEPPVPVAVNVTLENSADGKISRTCAPVTLVVLLLPTTMTYVVPPPALTSLMPLLLVIDKSVCGGAVGVMMAVSPATLLVALVSVTPAGAFTDARLVTAPVAVGLSTAVTV